jgi:hypothetical protein
VAFADDDFDFDAHLGEEGIPNEFVPPAKASPRRGMLIAAVVGGVALIGAVGAYALSGGGDPASSGPALVKADTDPVKVKPENPGGVTVPNQQSGVFDRAAGESAAKPDQQELISTEEEPVDMAERFPEAAAQPIDESADIDGLSEAAPKGEDRIAQIVAENEEPSTNQETVAVAPRKVRTMVVKPDGSLVAREETEPEADIVGSTTAADSLTDPTISAPRAAEAAPAAAQPEAPEAAATAAEEALPPAETAAVQPPIEAAAPAEEAPEPAETTATVEPNATTEPVAPAAASKKSTTRAAMPESVPVAPSRPADQPLDIVGEVKPTQVAAVQPNAPAAGSWSMQIASEPIEAAAQSTYQDLAKRYS